MSNWKNDARWIIGDRKHEVFIEDDHFLVVEDEAFDYDGSYVCRTVEPNGDEWRVSAACGASYGYLNTLDKAPDAVGVEALRVYVGYEAWRCLNYLHDKEGACLLADMFEEATGVSVCGDPRR